MIITDSKSQQQDLINRVGVLAREKFAPRAAEYDRTATFPAEDFDDLFHAGLLAPVVPKEYGGYGLGPYTGDVFTLWMMTKEIAHADMSLARCWEGHVNSLVLLDGMSTEEQKARWFKGVVERGEHAAALLGLPYIPLREFDAEGYDIVVNATPVGRDTDEVPFKLERLNDDAVVIDLVYGSRPTPLVGTTRGRRQIAIDGRDVLVTQVRRQFQLMTGKEMSTALAREILL